MSWTFQTKNSTLSQMTLKSLLDLLQSEDREYFVALTSLTTKSPIQQFSSKQAENVYVRLVNISKNQKERKNWKGDQTNYLFFIVDKYCILKEIQPKNFQTADWQEISLYVPGRSGNECKFRFMAMTSKNLPNEPWNSQEKQLLVRIIQSQNSNSPNWKKISQKLYELNSTKQYRTGKQCRQQYTCFLNPNLKKGTWTIQQDYSLICLFQKYGRKWSTIAKEMQGRNQNAMKNRFFLLFQQKNKLSLSSSDLNKRIKRMKEKIEKSQFLKESECDSKQENIPEISQLNSSKTNQQTQRSNFQDSEQVMSSQSSLKGNIFIEKETPIGVSSQQGIFFEDQSESILRYISF